MKNDDEICKMMCDAYKDFDGNAKMAYDLKDKWIKEGYATVEQLDRCAKMLVRYFLEHGKMPDYDQNVDHLR
jgi:hypothetical protein